MFMKDKCMFELKPLAQNFNLFLQVILDATRAKPVKTTKPNVVG